MGKCIAFGNEFAEQIQGSNSLQPTTAATTVRVRDGKPLITDPFAETKEQLAGYYLDRGGQSGQGDRPGGAEPGRASRLDRSAAHQKAHLDGERSWRPS